MSIRPVVPKIFERYVEQGCGITKFPTKVMDLIFQMAFFDHFYSRKGLTETQKLQKQTKFALKEGEQNKKKGIKNRGDPKDYLISPAARFCNVISKTLSHSNKDLFKSVKSENYAVAESFGCKDSTEDGFFVINLTIGAEKIDIYSVCDGHADRQKAGRFLSLHLGRKLTTLLTDQEINDANVTNALTSSIIELSEEYTAIFGNTEGGTTFVCMMCTAKKYYFANVGDSRVIKIENDSDSVQQLSEDATPANLRFRKSYGSSKDFIVHNDGVWSHVYKVGLAMARDIGLVFACHRPKITCMDRIKEKPGYFVLATDGLWDVATNQEVRQFISQMHINGHDLDAMAKSLVESAHETCKESVQHDDGIGVYDYADNILALMVKV